jgi:hypothetical protein
MDFCDLDCKFASFPKWEAVDGSRSCRTFIALYCRKKKSLVHKNLPCSEKQDGRGKTEAVPMREMTCWSKSAHDRRLAPNRAQTRTPVPVFPRYTRTSGV